MTKTILKITGMHCTSCAMNIDGELEDLGVKEVRTNYSKGITEVEYDSEKIKIEKIQETIQKMGYSTSIK